MHVFSKDTQNEKTVKVTYYCTYLIYASATQKNGFLNIVFYKCDHMT